LLLDAERFERMAEQELIENKKAAARYKQDSG
jgi:hypothetical protein